MAKSLRRAQPGHLGRMILRQVFDVASPVRPPHRKAIFNRILRPLARRATTDAPQPPQAL